MMTKFGNRRLAAVALTAALAACGGDKSAQSAPAASDSAAQATTPDSASGAVARSDTTWGPRNTMGRIPILEYHVIGEKEGQYTVTKEHLLKDLQLVYDRGYRPITIAQMLDKDFSPVPNGMSPVVFVFDDASDSQFRYVERNGKLEIDPTSAVGIWQARTGRARRSSACSTAAQPATTSSATTRNSAARRRSGASRK
jgi:hypothetical protein